MNNSDLDEDDVAEDKRLASILTIGKAAEKLQNIADEQEFEFLSHLLRAVVLETTSLLQEDDLDEK